MQNRLNANQKTFNSTYPKDKLNLDNQQQI